MSKDTGSSLKGLPFVKDGTILGRKKTAMIEKHQICSKAKNHKDTKQTKPS